MAQFITTSISNGQAVLTDQVYLVRIVLTAGAGAPARAIVYGNGVPMIYMAAVAGDMNTYPGDGSKQLDHIPGPVTVDLSGAGAALKLVY